MGGGRSAPGSSHGHGRTTRIALLALLSLLVAATARAEARPNVLLLVAEDLSPRLGAYGDAVAKTPRLDGLAAEGVRYWRVFTTAGVCAPSRAALVTGVHAVTLGAQHMRASSRPAGGYTTVPPPHVKAFPELLRRAGYYTYTSSKLDYQFSGTLYGSGPVSIWDDEGPETHWRKRAEGQPFFGLVNFQVTHESGVFTPLGSWPHSLVHFFVQLARWWYFDFHPEPVTSPDDVVVPPYYPDTPTVRADLARHYDNIHFMDAQVGALLDQLEEDGLAESTIVIFTTDHGDGLPRAKRDLFDLGLHVPMIVRTPEALRPPGAKKPGSWDGRLVSFVDLAPTILGLAGLTAPDWMQGRDFLQASSPPRRYVFAARDRIDEIPDRQRAVRDMRFKYIRSWRPEQPGGHRSAFRDNLDTMRELWTLLEAGRLNAAQRRWFEPSGEERLFDTQRDPFELTDLSKDPAQAARLARMRSALDAWMVEVEDTGDVPEEVLVKRFWPDGVQPVTPAPSLRSVDGRVLVENATPGASSELRVDSGPWRLFVAPLAIASGSTVEARSVRYGWEESGVVTLRTP